MVVKEFMSLGLTEHSGQEVVIFLNTYTRHVIVTIVTKFTSKQ